MEGDRRVQDVTKPIVSPLYYEDYSVYPPTFVLTCDYDSLTNGTLTFIENLKVCTGERSSEGNREMEWR